MTVEAQVEQAVFDAIDELNVVLPTAQRLEKARACPIFGEQKRLESMNLVNLIVSVEEKVLERCDTSVVLANERAMSQKSSPFRTVGTLIDFTATLVKEEQASRETHG